MVEPLLHVRNIASPTTDADNVSYQMSRIQINPQSDATSPMLVDDDPHQSQLQPLGIQGSTVIAMPNQQEEYRMSTKRDLQDYNLDGLNCSICMEPWTLHGDHQVSCLPCGHIYGLSCINKWIQHSRIHFAKCPQCNAKIGAKDVTKLYASPVFLVDKKQQKKDEISEAERLKTERSNLLLIQDSLLKELRLLKKQLSNGTMHLEASRRNTDELMTGEPVHETQKGIKYGGRFDGCGSSHCKFVLQHEMSVGNARMFDMDACYRILLLARRVPGMGGRHVLDKINMMNPIEKEEITLPLTTKAVKDLHISPCGRLALLASLGKKLSIISMGSNSIVVTYNLPSPAWSCSWDINTPNYMYAGLQNGMLLVFDMRHTIHPVQSMHGLNSRPIHTIHTFDHNTSHPQSVTQLLTASPAGPCLWNINGGMQRLLKVPELESEEASCMSLAYSSSSEDIIATYRPKASSSIQTRPCLLPGEFAPSSLLLAKRATNSIYFKLKSASAQLSDVGITKSTVINVENCLPVFAYGNDVANGLRLLEIPSLTVAQNLKPHQHPILDVKYSPFQGSCVLGCISQDKLQLFSAKVL